MAHIRSEGNGRQFKPMSQEQMDICFRLAENFETASKLVRRLDENYRWRTSLWAVYCVALITISYGAKTNV